MNAAAVFLPTVRRWQVCALSVRTSFMIIPFALTIFTMAAADCVVGTALNPNS